jgi:copper chaperone CopZ
MQPIRLKIEGMGATGAIEAVENALRTVPGVLHVRVDPVHGDEVHVEVAETVDPELLVDAVLNAGYIATLSG